LIGEKTNVQSNAARGTAIGRWQSFPRLTHAGLAEGCRVIEIDETSGETLDRVAWLEDSGADPGCAFLTTLRRGSWAVSLLAGDLLLSYVLRGVAFFHVRGDLARPPATR
jgi:hypothetical protein